MNRLRRRPRLAFTLIELLIVFFIIGTLAALTFPQLRRQVSKADLSGCQQNLYNLSLQVQIYAADHGGTMPGSLSELIPNYLAMIPTCPSASTDTYTNGFSENQNQDGATFTIYCNGNNHSDLQLTNNQPFYTLSQGLGP